jgi:hypothetical protein
VVSALRDRSRFFTLRFEEPARVAFAKMGCMASPETQTLSSSPLPWAQRAHEHCRFLSEEIGPRPVAQEGEEAAARYALQVLEQASLQARRELTISARSTYRPYSIALSASLLGNMLATGSRSKRLIGAVLCGAGAWAFAQESDLKPNWAQNLLPTGDSQNIVAIVPASSERKRRVVICAHLDSHRTPIFYSHPLWLKVFSGVTAATFASTVASALRHGSSAALRRKDGRGSMARWGMLLQAASLALTLQAETTPHTHGANDNASGAATVLALAQRLAQQPLENTEVWVALLGGEEVGCQGAHALLRRHAKALKDASFLNFDMVGIGSPAVLESEGLIRRRECDPHLRALAFQVADESPDLIAGGHAGPAYTDANVFTQAGLAALTIDSIVPEGHAAHARGGYWHQTSDTFDKIEPECLAKTHEFGWQLLQKLDQDPFTVTNA